MDIRMNQPQDEEELLFYRNYETTSRDVITLDSDFLESIHYGQQHGDFYLNYFLYVILELQRGPLTIILDYSPILKLVLLARIIHYLLDLLSIRGNSQKVTRLLKNLSTGLLGSYQLYNYSKRFSQSESITCGRFLFFSTSYYLILIILHSLANCKNGEQHTKHETKVHINQNCVPLVTLGAFAPILVNEGLILKGYTNLTSLRGILMAFTMKATSQMVESTTLDLAYLLHPTSCVLGLWHPNLRTTEHSSCMEVSTRFLEQIIQSLKTFAKTYCILIVSANMSFVTENLDSFTECNPLKLAMHTYLIAQEFRFSHYFVSYLAQFLFDLWTDPAERIMTCRMSKVEWPRSLNDVVVFWNITMHKWLKNCIFIPIKRMEFNSFVTITFTYLISSMLHGLKFHIWSVLLTLGYLTWTEHQLRLKLAKKFGACIQARECKYTKQRKCMKGHLRTKFNSPVVRIVNLLFTLLALVHLAYLGLIFVSNTDQATHTEALDIWSACYYYGHILAIATHLISHAL